MTTTNTITTTTLNDEKKRVRWNGKLFDIRYIEPVDHDSISDIFYNSDDIDDFEIEAIQDDLLGMDETRRRDEVALAINRWMTEDTHLAAPQPDFSCPPALPRRYVSDEDNLGKHINGATWKFPSMVPKTDSRVPDHDVSSEVNEGTLVRNSSLLTSSEASTGEDDSISSSPKPSQSIINNIAKDNNFTHPQRISFHPPRRPNRRSSLEMRLPVIVDTQNTNHNDAGIRDDDTKAQDNLNKISWYSNRHDHNIADDSNSTDDHSVKHAPNTSRGRRLSIDMSTGRVLRHEAPKMPNRQGSIEIPDANAFHLKQQQQQYSDRQQLTANSTIKNATAHRPVPCSKKAPRRPNRRASIETTTLQQRCELHQNTINEEKEEEYKDNTNHNFIEIPVLALGLSFPSARFRLAVDVAEHAHYYKASHLKKLRRRGSNSDDSSIGTCTTNSSHEDSLLPGISKNSNFYESITTTQLNDTYSNGNLHNFFRQRSVNRYNSYSSYESISEIDSISESTSNILTDRIPTFMEGKSDEKQKDMTIAMATSTNIIQDQTSKFMIVPTTFPWDPSFSK